MTIFASDSSGERGQTPVRRVLITPASTSAHSTQGDLDKGRAINVTKPALRAPGFPLAREPLLWRAPL